MSNKSTYSLECAECSCDVFERDEDTYYEGRAASVRTAAAIVSSA
ncbi:hypothetical protein LCGC14_0575710 [marine sediment metagenome]|uniref:Uncharacterized protein n=1 Tax=marine sediment metagenome TaxID=412755 RepID=A0A0F9UR67_9ZZZZ